MSLSDYIKYQRALKGGLTPWEIAEGSGVPAREVHLIEVKHRRMGEDPEVLKRLAYYFSVPIEELEGRREAYRKRLTYFLEECKRDTAPIELKLEGGETVAGRTEWYSREAIALNTDDERDDLLCVVQRAWVADWRRSGSPEWEVADTPARGESAD